MLKAGNVLTQVCHTAGHQHHPVSVATWHFIVPTFRGPMSASDPSSLAGLVDALFSALEGPPGALSLLHSGTVGNVAGGITRSSTAAAIAAVEPSAAFNEEGGRPVTADSRERRTQKDGPLARGPPGGADAATPALALAVEGLADDPGERCRSSCCCPAQ